MNLSKGFIYSTLAAFVWAISIVLLKSILQSGENAFNIIFWVTIFGLPFWLYLLNKNKSEVKELKVQDFKILLAMGLISAVGVSFTEFLAIKYSSAINYSFLIRTSLVFTFLFAFIFLNERPTKKKLFLAFIVLIGSYLLTTEGKLLSLSGGDLFTITEAALIALGNHVLGKMAVNRMSIGVSSSISVLIGFLPKIIIAMLLTKIVVPISLFHIILLTLTYILLTQLRFHAYKHASVSYVTMIFSFTPVFVSFMAILLLGETMSVIQIIGGILIIMAGVMVEKLKI